MSDAWRDVSSYSPIAIGVNHPKGRHGRVRTEYRQRCALAGDGQGRHHAGDEMPWLVAEQDVAPGFQRHLQLAGRARLEVAELPDPLELLLIDLGAAVLHREGAGAEVGFDDKKLVDQVRRVVLHLEQDGAGTHVARAQHHRLAAVGLVGHADHHLGRTDRQGCTSPESGAYGHAARGTLNSLAHLAFPYVILTSP